MDSNSGLDENAWMTVEGWITVTPDKDPLTPTIYGIFEDKESAENWARNCKEGTVVRPIWTPQFSRG